MWKKIVQLRRWKKEVLIGIRKKQSRQQDQSLNFLVQEPAVFVAMSRERSQPWGHPTDYTCVSTNREI